MNGTFSTFLKLGFEHISDLNGYDHILFIVALCAIYRLAEWRKVAVLVTAFTIGHSITLALAALDVITISTTWVEFLIPVTIVLTGLYNVYFFRFESDALSAFTSKSLNLNYFFALVFGLIHGMGFSNFFKASLFPGEEGELITQLLAFNIGVELGQLTIVAVVLFSAYLAINVFKARQREWNLFISGAACGIALIMALERFPG